MTTTSTQHPLTQDPTHMRTHTVRGAGDVLLHVREWGPHGGTPIVLIHGISQSHQCWTRQYDSSLVDEFRLVAYDLRGHGMSETPADAASYRDERMWADDLAAVVDHLGLERAPRVGKRERSTGRQPADARFGGRRFGGFRLRRDRGRAARRAAKREDRNAHHSKVLDAAAH